MKTFALVQGDLSPSPGGYLLYEGAQKIQQDLTLALREDYGGDKFHPLWGSILPELIGNPITADVKQQIIAEISRVVSNYITVQNARIVQDNATGSTSRMSTDDVVQAIGTINVKQIYDSVVASVQLQTMSRQEINVNQVIS